MTNPLRTLLATLAALCLASTACSATGLWQTNYKAALAEAATEHKMVLINFTGSDWCPFCILLERQIFSQPAFKDYAAKNLVLLELDFPQGKPQSQALQAQNMKLLEKYHTDGLFPTLVLLNSQGKEIARHEGGMQGGPAAFIKWVESVKKG